ncbi:MAG: translation initiation factor IF-3 [Coriobacteriia bacterium]|nr:translation initiation factor IF-3 [Coriobacteriia bacterium]
MSSEYRVNEEISAGRCRLIAADGEQLGIFDVRDAMRKADDQGYDLVEIAPQADPPVCKIMDFGKFRYEQSMKAKAARKHQQKIEVKEMKFRPKVDTHDYNTKKRHILRFLDSGAKVKVTIMFRGREMAHPELGLNILVRLAEELEDLAVIENQPKLEGRNMHMLISPLRKKPEKSADTTVEN